MVKLHGLVGRLMLIGAAVVTAVGVSAAPASARVLVSADNPQAGATNVTLSFFAQARSGVAGIAFLRVVLPAGIRSDDVTLLSAPRGWNFSSTPDGYNVGGPALDVGESARYQVNVERLPSNATRLAFETLQTYSDGRIESDNQVPVLVLAPARRPAPARPPVPSRAPVEVPPPAPIPPSEPAEVPPPIPSIEPTFTLPTELPSAQVPATIDPAPTSSATALVAQRSGLGLVPLISVAAVLMVLALTGFLAWLRRRRTRAGRVSI